METSTSPPRGIYNCEGYFPYEAVCSNRVAGESVYGDIRIGRRLEELLEQITLKQRLAIHGLSSSYSQQRAFYRLMHNNRLDIHEMLEESLGRMSGGEIGEHVLLIEDSSKIQYKDLLPSLKHSEGLGRLSHDQDFGYYLHPSLCVDPTNGFPVGISDVQIWHLDDQMPTYDQRVGEGVPFTQKSSVRWLRAALNSRKRLGEQTHITVVADREADIYESLSELRASGIDFVIRAKHNRSLLNSEEHLFSLADSLEEQGRFKFKIPLDPRKDAKRMDSEVEVAIRFAPISIKRSYKAQSSGIRGYPPQLEVYLIDMREVVPKGSKPIHWRILSSHPVTDMQSARQIIQYYRYRWIIEQLFRLLKKQGLGIEQLELKSGMAILRMGVLALEAALKMLQFTYAHKAHQPIAVERMFTPEEIPLLRVLNQKYEGRTAKQKNPFNPHELQWATWIIARIGGWKSYQSQRPPGPITFKRGWQEFERLLEGVRLAQMINPCNGIDVYKP
ncbi:MAG: IS4 family transposase [Bacteroidota bacterium]